MKSRRRAEMVADWVGGALFAGVSVGVADALYDGSLVAETIVTAAVVAVFGLVVKGVVAAVRKRRGTRLRATRHVTVDMPAAEALDSVRRLVREAGGRPSVKPAGVHAQLGAPLMSTRPHMVWIHRLSPPMRAVVRVESVDTDQSEVVVTVRDVRIGTSEEVERSRQALEDVADALSDLMSSQSNEQNEVGQGNP